MKAQAGCAGPHQVVGQPMPPLDFEDSLSSPAWETPGSLGKPRRQCLNYSEDFFYFGFLLITVYFKYKQIVSIAPS